MALPPTTSAEEEACARVAVVIGQAINQAGVKLKAGEKILKGTRIRTGPSSLVKLILIDESIVDLGSSSQLRIAGCQGKNWVTKINLEMENGALRALVNKSPIKKRDEFKLKTITSVLAVRGTEFFVAWQKNKQGKVFERVGVSEGRVEVTSLFSNVRTPFSINSGTEFKAQGFLLREQRLLRVQTQDKLQIDQFSAQEQRSMEEKTKVEDPVFKESVDLSGEVSANNSADNENNKVAEFITEKMDLGTDITQRDLSSEESKDWAQDDPTSSGAGPDAKLADSPTIDGPIIISIPSIVRWAITK